MVCVRARESFMKKTCQLQVIQYLTSSDQKKVDGGGRYLTRDNRYALHNCSKQQLKFYRSHLLNCNRTSHEIFLLAKDVHKPKGFKKIK